MIPAPSAFLPEGVAGRIRKVAAAAEKMGRLHPDILTLAFEQQWFRSLVPKRYGGLALPLPAMVRLEEGLSWADGSLGWTVTLCSGAGWFAGFFPPASFPEMGRQAPKAEKVEPDVLFGDPGLCLAGSGTVSGHADVVDGGYRVSGRWPYASGAAHATAFTANCAIHAGGMPVMAVGGGPLVRPFLFLREEVVVDHDWNAVGLVATGSHGFAVRDLVVPAGRAFRIAAEAAINDDPLYKYPFMPLAEATLAANSSGMARHFLDCCTELGVGGSDLEAADSALVERRMIFYRELDRSWEEGSRGSQEGVSRASKELASAALYWVDKLYPQMGLFAARIDTAINRVWRDLHTASQHPLLR